MWYKIILFYYQISSEDIYELLIYERTYVLFS